MKRGRKSLCETSRGDTFLPERRRACGARLRAFATLEAHNVMLSCVFMKAVLMGGVGVTALNKGLACR